MSFKIKRHIYTSVISWCSSPKWIPNPCPWSCFHGALPPESSSLERSWRPNFSSFKKFPPPPPLLHPSTIMAGSIFEKYSSFLPQTLSSSVRVIALNKLIWSKPRVKDLAKSRLQKTCSTLASSMRVFSEIKISRQSRIRNTKFEKMSSVLGF